MSPTEPVGAARMRALAADLPVALEAGFRSGRDRAAPNGTGSSRIFAFGMGGSGIAADLARGVVESETAASLTLVRGFEPPRALRGGDRAMFVSYSGDTWETVRAYETAGRVGAHRTVITSGGQLAERAESENVPVVLVPPGIPPRSAVGYLFGGVLGLLDHEFPESNEERVHRTAEETRREIAHMARGRGPASALARTIGDRFPIFYGEGGFYALARRWATQVEENAKRLAAFDEVPEAFHNAIVGWDGLRRPEAGRVAAILLEWSGQDPMVSRSLRYLERLLKARGAAVARAALSAEDRLEALVRGISLGDHLSFFLADRRRVDPLPVDAIGRLKGALGTQRGPAA